MNATCVKCLSLFWTEPASKLAVSRSAYLFIYMIFFTVLLSMDRLSNLQRLIVVILFVCIGVYSCQILRISNLSDQDRKETCFQPINSFLFFFFQSRISCLNLFSIISMIVDLGSLLKSWLFVKKCCSTNIRMLWSINLIQCL